MKAMRTWKEQDAFRKSMDADPDIIKARKSTRIVYALETFRRNLAWMVPMLEDSRQPGVVRAFQQYPEMNPFIADLSRRLFNLVSSGRSTLYQIEYLHKDLFGSVEAPPQFATVFADLAVDENFQLLDGLRQFYHSDMPLLLLHNGEFAIDSQGLLTWKKWSSAKYRRGRSLIASPHPLIKEIATRVSDCVYKFATHYDAVQRQVLRSELEKFDKMNFELLTWTVEDIPRIVQSHFQSKRGFEAFEVDLYGYLARDQWHRVKASARTRRPNVLIEELKRLGIDDPSIAHQIQAIYTIMSAPQSD